MDLIIHEIPSITIIKSIFSPLNAKNETKEKTTIEMAIATCILAFILPLYTVATNPAAIDNPKIK